jgi:hypothetical protein
MNTLCCCPPDKFPIFLFAYSCNFTVSSASCFCFFVIFDVVAVVIISSTVAGNVWSMFVAFCGT